MQQQRRRRYTRNINIRLRPGEKDKIDAAAKALGIPTSWWMRRVLMTAAAEVDQREQEQEDVTQPRAKAAGAAR